MLKNKKIIIGVGLIFIIIGLIVFSNKTSQLLFQEEIGALQENTEQKVVLVIDDDEGILKIFQAEYQEGMTAFNLLSDEAGKLNLKIKTYDIGIFIEAIGEKENGEGGKYWVYYINGEMPSVAADKTKLKPGDKVEFKFEKSPF